MHSLPTDIVLLIGCAMLIYWACGYFVNGIEWLGQRLKLGQTATGSVLAALGTALPESAVTFVAVAFGGTAEQREIGIGAALGGPLVLSTLGYAIVGLALVWRARRRQARPVCLELDARRLRRDQAWFVNIFVVKLALGLALFTGKPWCALWFLGAYILYVTRELRQRTPADGISPERLRLSPKSALPPTGLIWSQTLGSLLVIGFVSHFFVGRLAAFSAGLGLSPQLVALLLSPIATELPEIMNALIWVRQGKERLALANISGAMMIQATIPSAFGLIFTPWVLSTTSLAAGGVTLLAVGLLWALFRRRCVSGQELLPIGLLYGLFIGLVVMSL